MKQINILILFLVLVVTGAFLTGCTTGKTVASAGNIDAQTSDGAKDTSTETQLLAKAPDFTVTTISGETVSRESFLASGKPTLVYFMASWCPTCAKNWPSLNQIYTEYGDRVNLVAISIDPTDTQEVLNDLAAKKGLIFPIVPGNPQLMLDFGVKGQATTVGIDSEGNIQFIKSGEFSLDEYRSMVEELLN